MSLNKEQPIGIFDSGIGGLTVANAISELLPEEQIIYFGDTEHLPYGDKSAKAIQHYSKTISEFLLNKNCKAIVVACNTASSHAYDLLVNDFGSKAIIVNVVDPIVDNIVTNNSILKAGIIGTKGTIASGIYEKKLKARKSELTVSSKATPLLAPMIEEGFIHDDISKGILKKYLSSEFIDEIDALVLACTHYPIIKKDIEHIFKNAFLIFDSTDVTANSLKEKLKSRNLLAMKRSKDHEFFVSDYTDFFELTAKQFYGSSINLEHFPLWKH